MITNYNKLLSDRVNFKEGYSMSEFWIGYFERNKDFSLDIVNETINFFIENFSTFSKDLIIVTSYYIDDENLLDVDNYTSNIETDLSKKGYIRHIDGNIYFSKDDDVFEKQLFDMETSFNVFSDFSLRDLECFSFLAMVDSNVQGHCFFILEKENLIIYPHSDDTGYGCIGIYSRDSKEGLNFLYDASQNGKYDSFLYIEKDKCIKKI